jgi:hypothetical protein
MAISFDKPAPGLSCGPCAACCDVLGVRELGKPYYARCPHVRGGCTIYETRPQMCRTFHCCWMLGMLGAQTQRRPDQLGLMFNVEWEPANSCNVVEVYETAEGALAADADRLRFLIGKVLTARPVARQPRDPHVRLFPFGANIHLNYEARGFDYAPPPGEKIRLEILGADTARFVGPCHGLLLPKGPRD